MGLFLNLQQNVPSIGLVKMDSTINRLVEKIEKKGLKSDINLDRPIYLQPEDRIKYRAMRILLIISMFKTKHGLSKKIIACVDFLLRNTGFQSKFIVEYFKDRKNLYSKLEKHLPSDNIENDFNVVLYKSVPWDLRFNDMLLYLKARKMIKYTGKKETLRFFLTEKGDEVSKQLGDIFPSEINFLELFGKSLSQDKTVEIITEIIPNTYWRENEKLIC